MSDFSSLPPLLRTADDFCVLRGDIADKLIRCGDGDGALLYLYILRRGRNFSAQTALRELGFSRERYDRAMFTLGQLSLPEEQPIAPHAPTRATPAYRTAELRQARGGDMRFAAVCDTAEAVLGRTLTEGQLRTLFIVYDHLGLPADVIIELLTYLKREKGTVKRSDIEREACLWADMGLFTAQEAATYLSRRDAEKPLIRAMQEALGIGGREPTDTEARYLTEFIAKGFGPEAVALAAHRTEQSLGKFSWNYLRKIIASWDQKGIHTVSEISAVDPERGSRTESTRAASAPAQPAAPVPMDDWESQWLAEVKRRRRKEEP